MADTPCEVEMRSIGFSDPDFALAAAVRRRVFIEEQHVPEDEEWDAADEAATHLLAVVDGRVVGTLRFYEEDGWMRVGRVCVLRANRGLNIGRSLILECLKAGLERGYVRSFINAQTDKAGFYRKFGFREVGDEFMETGIPHVRMELFF